jgi:hypothetical protein
MKLVIDIEDNNLAEGLSVLKQLDFIHSIEEFPPSSFDEKWVESSNLSLTEARIRTKSKVRELWRQK